MSQYDDEKLKKKYEQQLESSFTLFLCLSSYVTSNLPNYLTIVLKKGFYIITKSFIM